MHVKTLCLFAFLAMATTAHAGNTIMCYYEQWAKYRKGSGKYTINDIPTKMCTHVLYSFVGINNDGSIKLLDDASDITNFVKHVSQTSGVKPLLSIGGASEGPKKFSNVVSSSSTRERFVKNAVDFLEKHKFEGLDVDWEYPNDNNNKPSDKHNYVLLLKELKEAFSPKGWILSAAVAADPDSVSQSYDIPQVSKYLDFINVMAYDFFGTWNSKTGMNAPLYSSNKDSDYEKTLNVDASITYWINNGAPPEKLILGLPFYGHSYTLKNPNNHGLFAKTSGPGEAGPFTEEKGLLGYNEMCVYLKNGGWTTVRGGKTRVPYAYKGNQWVSYDDVQSIKEKAEYARNKGLGGAMVWAIDTDDFKAACGKKNALLRTVKGVIRP